MKLIIKLVLLIVIGLVGSGYYINYNNDGGGEKFIGIGVLIFAFVLMPLFIYHRYNGKDLSRYSIRNLFQNEKDVNKK
jgi:hypothetical protein